MLVLAFANSFFYLLYNGGNEDFSFGDISVYILRSFTGVFLLFGLANLANYSILISRKVLIVILYSLAAFLFLLHLGEFFKASAIEMPPNSSAFLKTGYLLGIITDKMIYPLLCFVMAQLIKRRDDKIKAGDSV